MKASPATRKEALLFGMMSLLLQLTDANADAAPDQSEPDLPDSSFLLIGTKLVCSAGKRVSPQNLIMGQIKSIASAG